MLINFDSNKPLYIVGTGTPAIELRVWIYDEYNIKPQLIERQNLNTLPNDSQCIPGFANREFRLKLVTDTNCQNHNWVSYFHPSSLVISTAQLGHGTVIHPMTTVGHNAVVGNFGWFAPYCLIGHGDILGNNVVLGPGVIVGGSTNIGNNVSIGLGSKICNKISICSDTEFLMTSIVTNDIDDPGTYYGNRKTINN